MTILARVVKPGFELTVCGTVSQDWLDWVRTTAVPLTAAQHEWREIAQARDAAEVADA